MKKTVITKCGEELLGPQASLRVTPYQPVPNHIREHFDFAVFSIFSLIIIMLCLFFFFVFPSFMSSYTFGPLWYFSDTVLVRVSCLFFPFFFSFFLFGIRYNIFLSVYVIITTYFFFQIFTSEITWQCFLRLFHISPIRN